MRPGIKQMDTRNYRIDTTAVITGGRYDDRKRVLVPSNPQMFRFERLLFELKIKELWHGGAIGTDQYVAKWVKEKVNRESLFPWKVRVRSCRVNTRIDGPWPAAGHKRNERMLRTSRARYLIAFPGAKGTSNCISTALSLKLEVWRWDEIMEEFLGVS